ncbi:MAG: NTP transferase domain-containing protein [Caldisericia bacterium]|nr:NTP transferase domain-containing protein [Caldisericia bacterium]
MKKIKLLLDNFYLLNEEIYKNGKVIFSRKFDFNYPRFSFIILSARKFDKEKILKILNSFNQKEIYEYIFIVGKEEDKNWLMNNLNILNGKVIVNPNPQDVLYTSIKLAMRGISEKVQYICFHFSTLSNIKSETVKYLIEKIIKTDKEIFIPTFNNKRGHPIIFKISMKKILFNLRKEKGLPYILKKYKDKIEDIEVDDIGVLK